MSDFQSETFVPRESNLYAPFIYQQITGTKNTEHCSVHCYFDAEDHCDFHFLSGSNCYLGNFNTETPVGSSSSTYTTYIFKGKNMNL